MLESAGSSGPLLELSVLGEGDGGVDNSAHAVAWVTLVHGSSVGSEGVDGVPVMAFYSMVTEA